MLLSPDTPLQRSELNLIHYIAVLTACFYSTRASGLIYPGKGLVANDALPIKPSSTSRGPPASIPRQEGDGLRNRSVHSDVTRRQVAARRGVGHKEKVKDADHKVKSAVKKWSEKAADELVVKGKDGKSGSEGSKSDAQDVADRQPFAGLSFGRRNNGRPVLGSPCFFLRPTASGPSRPGGNTQNSMASVSGKLILKVWICTKGENMRALVWHGKEDIRCDTVTDPEIQDPRDAIIKVTSCAICGSDLTCLTFSCPGMKSGDIMGHETMGEVVEVGQDNGRLKNGDRIVVPFTIICGECEQCRRGNFSVCERTNRNKQLADKVFGHTTAGLFGYTHLTGGYPGGQAEYLRVPFADATHIKVPEGIPDEQLLFLSDIFPTGWQAAAQCDIEPTDTVAIWGCGPVGQMAIRSAILLGAKQVIAIDRLPERLSWPRPAAPSRSTSRRKRYRAAERTHRRQRPGKMHRRDRPGGPCDWLDRTRSRSRQADGRCWRPTGRTCCGR